MSMRIAIVRNGKELGERAFFVQTLSRAIRLK